MKRSKNLMIILALLMAMILIGCGSESNVKLKEFILHENMVSISMNESWTRVIQDPDTNIDAGVFSENGHEGIAVMQYEKMLYANNIYSIDTLKARIEDSFGLYNLKKTDNPDISDMQNVETYSCVYPSNGIKSDCMVLYGETDYAYYSIIYIADRIDVKRAEYFKNVCETFKETAPEIDELVLGQTTDTILWFNATCAILTDLNGWDYTIFGGLPASEATKFFLQNNLNSSWDVTDRATADESIDWLISEGNHVSFTADMQSIGESGIENISEGERVNFILENFEVNEEEAHRYVNWYETYKQYGDDTIAAWDYSRAMWLYASYYLAGYYTLEEALDASLAMAEGIQNSFDSWDSFMESYFMGYEYWGGESSDERRAVYEEIKVASDSPFNVDWNLEFEKIW